MAAWAIGEAEVAASMNAAVRAMRSAQAGRRTAGQNVSRTDHRNSQRSRLNSKVAKFRQLDLREGYVAGYRSSAVFGTRLTARMGEPVPP